jgi:hypothetical protein
MRRLALFLCLLPGLARAESGFTFGVEATSLFSLELKPKPNPSITRVRTDNLTSVSTTRSGDYFKDSDAVNGTSTTYTREWSGISTSANFLFVKGSYSTEFFETIVKLGSANRRIDRKEKTLDTIQPPGGASKTEENQSLTSSLVDLPQGFAYGFEIRGSPYQTENFSVLASIHYTQSILRGTPIESSKVQTTTTGVMLTNTSTLQQVDFDHYDYGLTLAVTANLLAVHPYLGLAYADGKLKGRDRTATVNETYTNGAIATSVSTVQTIEYTMIPNKKVSFVAGVSFPFERGSVNLEGKMQGENSISINAVLGF